MATAAMPQIPGYRIERQLGSGAMATVYLAIQQSLERPVALKIMAASLVADPTFCERFLKEGRIIAQLSHPHIVTIYDIGAAGSHYYMAMEYLAGGTLKERIRQGLAVHEALAVLTQIATALGYAHRRHFVHRDVKPANILFREDGSAVLSDFGIAKALDDGTQMTGTGWTVGTPNYMSPEQALGKPVDARSDLYSLGIVLYEMLTGSKPYQAADSFATALMHVNSPLPQLPPHLATWQPLLERLLAKEPAARYGSAEELLKALRSLPRPTPAKEEEPTTRIMPGPVPTRARWRWWLLPVLLLPFAGGAAYWLLRRGGEPPPPPPVVLDPQLQAQVDSLLQVAQAHFELERYTEPPGSNAAETYRRVLELDPGNAAARQGLQAIADALEARAQESLAGNDTAAGLQYVAAGLSAVPDHPGLRALERQLRQRAGQ